MSEGNLFYDEIMLAGCILREDTVIYGLDGLVSADDFQNEKCRAIYEAAAELAKEGASLVPTAIRERAEAHGVNISHQDAADMLGIVPTTAAFADYARRVAEDARKRRVKELAESIQIDRTATADELIERLQKEAGEISSGTHAGNSSFLSLFRPLTDFVEEEARWLVPGWIPEGQITLLAADGGIGKTTFWCHIFASLSNGKRCILDPDGYTRKPMKIAFCTTEDSVRKKLLKKLREAGANMENIIAMDMAADKNGLLRDFKFGSDKMNQYVNYFKPHLCAFDPVQGFVPPRVNMGSRNEMRDCLAPLVALGEDVGTAFLIICHTNKRKGAYGRDRIADSADLWDIARSVIMAGYTEEQSIRYLSNEKNNYTELQETVLFSINKSGQIVREGTSWKRDKDYMLDSTVAKSAPKREDCKEFILSALQNAPGQSMKSDDLIKKAQEYGYSFRTVTRVRGELKNEGIIENRTEGSAKHGNRVWYTCLKQPEQLCFESLPDDLPTPFDCA